MADNLSTSTTVATIPAATRIATYEIASFSGDANAHIAPTVLGTVSGSEGARTYADISTSNPLPTNARGQDGTGNALTSATRGSERALSVQIVDGSGAQITTFGGSGGTASNVGSAVPVTGTAAGFSDGTNLQLARVYDTDSGAGVERTLGVNLRLTANGGSVEAGTSANPLRVDVTGSTTQPVALASITTSVTPGTSAAHLGKAIDSPVGGTDTGVALLMRRIDTPVTVTPAVADWQELRGDSQGRAYVQVSGGITTGTLTNVAASVTNVTLLTANAARRGFIIYNDSSSILYVKCAATATATSWTWRLQAGEFQEQIGPCHTGIIDGIWVTATGTARVTEFS